VNNKWQRTDHGTVRVSLTASKMQFVILRQHGALGSRNAVDKLMDSNRYCGVKNQKERTFEML